VDVIRASAPKLVIFRASIFLFPEPVEEIREQVDPYIKFVYDATHVFVLVYSRVLQELFKEAVDFITSSTHKTFKGPQRGIIMGSSGLFEKVKADVMAYKAQSPDIH
jgi:glycine hydroxymethyltransferase